MSRDVGRGRPVGGSRGLSTSNDDLAIRLLLLNDLLVDQVDVRELWG